MLYKNKKNQKLSIDLTHQKIVHNSTNKQIMWYYPIITDFYNIDKKLDVNKMKVVTNSYHIAMNQKRIALITGITGQDGSYLAELLLSKGYEVHGITRKISFSNESARFERINHILNDIHLHYGDVTNHATVWNLIANIKPDEIYHLAAQSHVKVSFEDEFGTLDSNIRGTHNILSAMKALKPDSKFYFAGTSEMFGNSSTGMLDENTPLAPVSPYGISKVAGFYLTKMYRDAYGLFACSGILFNHESPRRGSDFVTRKITTTAAKIKMGMEKELRLGNLDAIRDWGHSADYVDAMWRMLNHTNPDDFVIGTGKGYTIHDFVKAVFDALDLDWEEYVVIDPAFYRPTDVHVLTANSKKAREVLGWHPQISFDELVQAMVDADMALYGK